MTCGDGERTRSRICTAGCENIQSYDPNHNFDEIEACNQSACFESSTSTNAVLVLDSGSTPFVVTYDGKIENLF